MCCQKNPVRNQKIAIERFARKFLCTQEIPMYAEKVCTLLIFFVKVQIFLVHTEIVLEIFSARIFRVFFVLFLKFFYIAVFVYTILHSIF